MTEALKETSLNEISLTPSAVAQVKHLQSSDPKNKGTYLRVKVVGGGCSGMSYKLDFESSEPTEKDRILDQDGVRIVVDQKSLLFLKGTQLDFSSGLNGKGFEFINPNAKRTCGCGSSFSA